MLYALTMQFDKQYYDQVYGTIHASHLYASYISHEVRKLPIGKRVLDVGAGCGALVKNLNWWGYEAYGTEISRYALDNKCHDNLIFGDIRALPFLDNSFDCIISVAVLQYIPEAELPFVFNELKRVAKKQYHAINYSADVSEFKFCTLKSESEWRTLFFCAGIENLFWKDGGE